MHAIVRRLAPAVMLLLVVGGAVGCAGSQKTSDGQADVQGQPPDKEPPDKLPEGPEVKVRSDYPKDDGAGGADSSASKSTDESRSEKEGESDSSSSAETITEAEREQFLEMGPSYVFQVVTFEPKRKDGEFRGYEIVDASGKARDVMNPQIEVGDVVTHVNDIRIERPSDYMKAWKAFGDRDRIIVDLLRDGEKQKAVWVIRSKERGRSQSDDR